MIVINRAQIVELDIEDLGSSGDGVGRWRDMAVFVPGALPGEKVKARIEQVKKSYARAVLEKILLSSPERILPGCRHFPECGGCRLQHVDYEAQLKYKRQVVVNALERIGKISGANVGPVLGMEWPWHYRNKIHLQVGGKKGDIKLGFYAPSTHRLVPAAGGCSLAGEKLNEVSARLEELLNEAGVEPYYWKNKRGKRNRGMLRHVMLRRGEKTGEVMVVLVTGPGEWKEAELLAEDLMGVCPEVVSVIRNINTKPKNVILGDKNIVLAGSEVINDFTGSLSFQLSPDSFYQVNIVQAERLYEEVRRMAELTGGETLVDSYCGTGTIGLYLADCAKKVIGIESVGHAVRDAQENARINNISNASFKKGKVENTLQELEQEGVKPDIVVLDPPRQGCGHEVLEAISKMGVQKVVYVSCDPGTMARDLGLLQAFGYHTAEVQPVDMFPWTSHVECVALIEQE